jgi:hypothetical protein
MATTIATNMSRTVPSSQPMGTDDRIGLIMKAMETVRKQLRALYKQLAETADPAVRMALIQRIDALKEMLHVMQEQILLLTQMEARRKHMRETGNEPPADQESPPAESPAAP